MNLFALLAVTLVVAIPIYHILRGVWRWMIDQNTNSIGD